MVISQDGHLLSLLRWLLSLSLVLIEISAQCNW